MVPPLVLSVWLAWLLAAIMCCRACRLSEFACDNGRCVLSSRFCDGNDDCGDLSDEPKACTNCNRTFYAEANVKTALRMSSPYQRPLPFVCSMTFVAAGGQFGDLVQLTFLSFQIGALEMDNDSVPTCQKGFLQIVEPPALTSALLSQQTRGFTQILSAVKDPTHQLSSLFDTSRGNPQFGRLCGDMIGKSATFYTEGNNVTIRVVIPGKAALHPFSFSVHLTFKYLKKDSSSSSLHKTQPHLHQQNPTNNLWTYDRYLGNKVTNTYCDRVLVNCDRKSCVLRSPNFPGFYLRNVTCHYWIRQESVPHGRHANIVLAQANEYKISLYTGRSSPLSYPHVSLTDECHGDVIRIFDGPSTASPLLVEFCGAGTLSEVISSSPEVLVQLYSAPNQALHHSFAEIDVGVRFVEASSDGSPGRDGGKCDFAVDGSHQRHGLLRSPGHALPRNTTCTFRLRGASPHDRVWFYFLSYFVEDRHPWSRRETCEAGSLEIYETTPLRKKKDAAALVVAQDLDVRLNRPDDERQRPIHRFCEKTYPRVCARAADTPDHVPVRPCGVPGESYLSGGPALLIRHSVRTSPLSAPAASFALRYEFVEGVSSPCDRLIEGRTGRIGSAASPRNVFLFGRGGSENVSCAYEFVGLPDQRILITFTDIRLRGAKDRCEHRHDPVLQRHTCKKSSAVHRGPVAGRSSSDVVTSASIRVVERNAGNAKSELACFCGLRSEPRRPMIVESVTNRVVVIFSVRGMGPLDDFEDFGFEAVYEFLPVSLCEARIDRKNGSTEGQVVFQVPPTVEGRAVPLRCRWLLEAAPHRYLYLRFTGRSAGDNNNNDCPRGENKAIVYSSGSCQVAPLSVVCLGNRGDPLFIDGAESASSSASSNNNNGQNDDRRVVDVFSDYWHNDSGRRLLRDHVYVEVLASRAEVLRFEWIEVTKPRSTETGSCPFECPELRACLSAELWCDGRRHCPSGYDEAPAHCDAFPTPYLVAGASSVALLLLLALLALLTLRLRRKAGEFKDSRPVPTDDFPMDGPHP